MRGICKARVSPLTARMGAVLLLLLSYIYPAVGLAKDDDVPKCPNCDRKLKCIEPVEWESGWFGEVEYRYRSVHTPEQSGKYDRDLGLKLGYDLSDDRHWDFRLALASGRADRPTSSWIEVDELDDLHWLGLDEYWARYDQPLAGKCEVRMQAGRFSYPFDATQLVFDSDLRVPMAYIEHRSRPGGQWDSLGFSVLGAHLRNSGQVNGSDAQLLSLRVDSRHEFSDSARLDSALSWHGFSGESAVQDAVLAETWRIGGHPGGGETSNYTDDSGQLTSGYELLDFWLKLQLDRDGDWPVSLEGEYVQNLAAAGPGDGRDAAWFLGLSVGQDDDIGDAKFELERVYIEPDAVLAALNRGSYATNYQGTSLGAVYIPFEHIELKLTKEWANSIFADAPLGAFNQQDLKLYVTVSW